MKIKILKPIALAYHLGAVGAVYDFPLPNLTPRLKSIHCLLGGNCTPEEQRSLKLVCIHMSLLNIMFGALPPRTAAS